MELEQSTSRTIQPIDNRNIVAVFVVHFDVHKGNVVEWQYPEEYNLEGIEYQAICSGLHRIKSDAIYFSRKNLYGVSVFQNKASEVERGAYMKAIGVLVMPTKDTGICGQVWCHQAFLENEINKHMAITETDNLDRYGNLLNYYNQYKLADDSTSIPVSSNIAMAESAMNSSMNYNLKQKHYDQQAVLNDDHFDLDSLEGFVNYYGPDVFVLWKAALLRKRIILENTPPMENVCKYVYYIYILAQVPSKFEKNNLLPRFVIGVNDIPELESNKANYIACTPDSIFQIKTNLYDLLVTNKPQKAHFKSNNISEKHNAADCIRFQTLRPSIIESKNMSSTLAAGLTNFYYWLYDDSIQAENSNRSTWQSLFAGSSHRRLGSIQSSEHDLLLFSENEDATEINNNHVFEAVVRASNDVQLQGEKNQDIIRFFHYFTALLLEKLQVVLSINEENGLQIIPIYPKDMVQLGLDPQADASFVTELAELYFKKKVYVHGLHNTLNCICLSKCI